MRTAEFWWETLERAIKTAAQFGLLAWGTTAFTVVGDVLPTAQATGLAMSFGLVLSALTSVATVNIGAKGTPSMVKPNG